MVTDLDILEALYEEPKSITEIKKDLICPDCGDNLMNGGNCLFCYCGWSGCA